MNSSHITQLRRFAVCAALCGSLLPVSAAVSVANGVMTISAPAGGLNSKVIVGPATGAVALFQVPGAGDGQAFSGIRSLRVVSGAGVDQVDLEITQTVNFDVFVDTGAGDSAVQVKWIIPPTAATLNPRLDVRQGAGFKRAQVDLESFGANVDFDWTHTASGAGSSEIKGEVEFKEGSRNAQADLRLTTSSVSADKVELIADSIADNLRLDIIGRGTDSINTKVLADDRGNTLDVLYDIIGDATANNVAFEMASAMPNVIADFAIDGGAQMDEVKLGMVQLVPGTIRSILDLDLAGGMDKTELKYDGVGAALTLTGLINSGADNDEIGLNSGFNTTSNLVISSGDGSDGVKAEIKGSLNSVGAASMRLLGGNGDDLLLLRAEGGAFGTPSVVDGGAGFDIGAGPGQVVNCEIVN
jgi:hypothetical protein